MSKHDKLKPSEGLTPQKIAAIIEQMNKNLPYAVTVGFVETFIQEFRAAPNRKQTNEPDYFDAQSTEIIAAYLNMMLMYATCPPDGCGNSIRVYREYVETDVRATKDDELIEFFCPVFEHWKERTGMSSDVLEESG